MARINTHLCLGIDPIPQELYSFESFKTALLRHQEFIDKFAPMLIDKILKPQLAFFLSFGSRGLSLLESFIDRYKKEFLIILDGKFGDISTTMQAYLDFVFLSLGAQAITINPFLGEKTIELAFESCAKYTKGNGRVYVLCATTEASINGPLAELQKNWQHKINACVKIRDQIAAHDVSIKKIAGVVIGANCESILFSPELHQSELSVLAPGLGAQGADFNIISRCQTQKNEFIFPLSRGIFASGQIESSKIAENLIATQNHFPRGSS